MFCYCSYTWDAQLIRGVFHLDISFSCWLRGIRVPFCVLWKSLQFLTGQAEGPEECGSGVFTAEEVDGVRDMTLGDSTMVDAETLLVVFF